MPEFYGDFDEAFASRIHMSLFYPELDLEKTRSIFDLNLEALRSRFNERNVRLNFDKSAVLSFAQGHFEKFANGRWNGRQIRNACQTVVALAEFDAEKNGVELIGGKNSEIPLELRHFLTVQKAYLDFSEYLGDIFGTDKDVRAEEHQYRAKPKQYSSPPGSKFSQRVARQQPPGRHWPDASYENSPRRREYSSYSDPSEHHEYRGFHPSSHNVGAEHFAGYGGEPLQAPQGSIGYSRSPFGPTAHDVEPGYQRMRGERSSARQVSGDQGTGLAPSANLEAEFIARQRGSPRPRASYNTDAYQSNGARPPHQGHAPGVFPTTPAA